ncbi:Uncharacterised protein [uncultured archaeon]|nr:Uncharacterised protein [uncultured archaeon]
MFVVQKLFGIRETARVESRNSSYTITLRPSDGLVKILAGLPKGSLVGIGDASCWDHMIHDTTPLPCYEYLRNRVNNVSFVYLDDLAFFAESREQLNLERIKTGMKTFKPDSGLDREIYECQVNASYADFIAPNAHVLGRIKETEPLVVVVNKPRADLFWFKPEYARLFGVSFNSYSSEELPKFEQDALINVAENFRFLPANVLSAEPAKNPKILAYFNSLVRQKKAIDEKRISDCKPDFMGTFDLSVPERGLFELHVKKRNRTCWEGTIEDAIGSATFVGFFDKKKAEFTRHYDASAVLLGAPFGNIAHRAYREGDKYVGTFVHPDVKGCFEMKEFS